jgi:hypothetical protein
VKRHRFDLISFVWGVVFTGLGVIILSDAIPPRFLWFRAFWPATIVVLGLAIFSSLRPHPRAEHEDPSLPPAS